MLAQQHPRLVTVVTGNRIVSDLERLGLGPRSVVLVHCSLSSLGHVPGGEQTLLLALRRLLGYHGTIVVPTQSWQLCDPAYLHDPAVPPEEWDEVRDALPAYDRRLTPSRGMGRFAEAVRSHPEAMRSEHPHRSFAAWGPDAGEIVARHALDDPVGEGSPLSVLYHLEASILFLGVGFAKCTALHLAESRSGLELARIPNGAPLRVEGERRWVQFTEPAVDDRDFGQIGSAFMDADRDGARSGQVGMAEARLVSLRRLVDFGAAWMAKHRQRTV